MGRYRLSRFFTQLYGAFTRLARSAADTLARGNSAHRKEKRMKLNRYLAGLLLASSVALALPAQAHRGGPGGFDGMQGGPGGARMLRQLDLTEQQRDQVFKIFHEQAPALREQAKAVRAAREELRKAAVDPGADAGRIRQLADAMGKAHADAAVQRAETLRRVAAVLTPEQRARLGELQARGREGRRQGHGERR
jgi:Spy/CpxP family protein refolding chaperone